MTQDTYTAPPAEPQKPKRNTLVIVIIVLLVLCCACILAAGLAWQFGDAVLRALGVSF